MQTVEVMGYQEYREAHGLSQERHRLVKFARSYRIEPRSWLVEKAISGSIASALAKAARLIIPPDNTAGNLSAASGSSSTMSSFNIASCAFISAGDK